MRNDQFYSREQLMEMPLTKLRGLDINSPEQQTLVQNIVNVKLSNLPTQRPVFKNDVPDIKTQDEEMRWQDIINERERRIRGEDDGSTMEPVPTSPELTPVDPIASPEQPSFTPESQPLAQPTEEGEPVTFSGEVSSALQTKVPVMRKTRTKK